MMRISKLKDWNLVVINYDALVQIIGQGILNSDVVHDYNWDHGSELSKPLKIVMTWAIIGIGGYVQ